MSQQQPSPTTTSPTPAVDHARLEAIRQAQQAFMDSGQSRDLRFRKRQLKALAKGIRKHQQALTQALHADLRKPPMEAYAAEIGFVLEEIRHTLAHLDHWAAPQYTSGPLLQAFSSTAVWREPYGRVLILSPWNYPFQLGVSPLVGALAAGNAVVLKPSEFAPHTAAATLALMQDVFPEEQVAVLLGEADLSQHLTTLPWGYCFFTGSPGVGRQVMAAAAQTLTPVTLELGGKSPAFVDHRVNLKVAAKRIVWGKFYNLGQTCVAPDYLLVDRRVADELTEHLKQAIVQQFGQDPRQSPDLGRIITDKHWQRLVGYLDQGRTLHGGQVDEAERYIAPTLKADVPPTAELLQDEIFGPILPIVPYDRVEEAIAFANQRPNPLTLYVFSSRRAYQEQVVGAVPSGSVAVNDILVHLTDPNLPFGGVGNSGMGAYHGRYSYETFSRPRGAFKRAQWLDPPMRYAPYTAKTLRLVKRLMPWPL